MEIPQQSLLSKFASVFTLNYQCCVFLKKTTLINPTVASSSQQLCTQQIKSGRVHTKFIRVQQALEASEQRWTPDNTRLRGHQSQEAQHRGIISCVGSQRRSQLAAAGEKHFAFANIDEVVTSSSALTSLIINSHASFIIGAFFYRTHISFQSS